MTSMPNPAGPFLGAPPGVAPGGAAPGGAAPAPAAKKSPLKTILVAGCSGCLVLTLSCCCIGGYLFYLEEVPYSAVGNEIARVSVVPGQPISLAFTWDGTGYAFTRYYIDAGADATYSTSVSGTFGCEAYGVLEPTPISTSYYGPLDDDHPGFILLNDDYRRSSPTPVACQGVLDISPPVANAFLVVTVKQRPSDWFAGI